jgi:predicted dehydrogenase
MRKKFSRRCLLRSSAAFGVGLAFFPARLARGYAANEKLNVALVGVGGRGSWFVDTIPRMENVVALCDVNDEKTAAALKHWEERAKRFATSSREWERRAAAQFQRLSEAKPKTYRDFRKMLDEMGKAIDAVVVATPDHTHAVASAAAIRAGKHVFCEKPLTRTVHESRALRELARKHSVATSMGNQGTYSGAFRRALELIRGGALGEIRPRARSPSPRT